MTGDAETLAEALFHWNTPSDPYFVIRGRDDTGDGDPYLPIAAAVLASGWLAAHDERVRAEERARAVGDVWSRINDLPSEAVGAFVTVRVTELVAAVQASLAAPTSEPTP